MKRLKMKFRKLKSDYGKSAYRSILDNLRYAGKIDIEEIKETEDYVEVIFVCYEKNEWIERVKERVKARLGKLEETI